ncbi:MAG TPA: nitrile hydratase subunit alpha [Oxalicibacterium sp.]|nr:nitrile hydratase subunit alpha [Oxalicibacterium sp.]
MSALFAYDEERENISAAKVRALEALLIEKGVLGSDSVDTVLEHFEKVAGPFNGAKIVARAWVDPAYKQRLLDDTPKAIAELNFPLGMDGAEGEHMKAVANTPETHNLIICTLCSCYPWPVLGLPPTWYKSAPYRSRVVIDPRGVLREFGVALGDDVQVRVWDSTAEIRYLVLPERPLGTEGMNEEQLANLVTRNAMVGVAKVSRTRGASA